MQSNLPNNLAWPAVWLINDLEANAYGVAAIAPEDFVILNEGTPDAEGNAAVIAAGTGLGEAGLYWDGKQHCRLPQRAAMPVLRQMMPCRWNSSSISSNSLRT